MSEIAQLTYKAAIMSAAFATLGADEEWDRRVTEYLRLDALQNAFAEYGALGQAAERHRRSTYAAKARYGAGWAENPKAQRLVANAGAAVNEAERIQVDQYLQPFWQAMSDLALTPAPTVAAAAFKALLIEADEIWNRRDMPDDCVKIVADDFARLRADLGGCEHHGRELEEGR